MDRSVEWTEFKGKLSHDDFVEHNSATWDRGTRTLTIVFESDADCRISLSDIDTFNDMMRKTMPYVTL